MMCRASTRTLVESCEPRENSADLSMARQWSATPLSRGLSFGTMHCSATSVRAQCDVAARAAVMVNAVTAVISLRPSAVEAFALRACSSLRSIAFARCSLAVSLTFCALEAAAVPVRALARSATVERSSECVTPLLASASSSGDGGTSAGESGAAESGAVDGVTSPADSGVARERCSTIDSA